MLEERLSVSNLNREKVYSMLILMINNVSEDIESERIDDFGLYETW